MKTVKSKREAKQATFKQAEVFKIKPRAITPYEHNPKSRVVDVKALEAQILEFGGMDPTRPVVIGCDYVLGDGHRRRQAAINIEIEEMFAVFDAGRTAEEIWAIHNRPDARKTITQCQRLEWYLSKCKFGAVDPNKIPGANNSTRAAIRLVQGGVGGPALLWIIAKSGQAPGRALHGKAYLTLVKNASHPKFDSDLKLLLYAIFNKRVPMEDLRSAYHLATKTGKQRDFGLSELRRLVTEAIELMDAEIGR